MGLFDRFRKKDNPEPKTVTMGNALKDRLAEENIDYVELNSDGDINQIDSSKGQVIFVDLDDLPEDFDFDMIVGSDGEILSSKLNDPAYDAIPSKYQDTIDMMKRVMEENNQK